MRYYILDFLDLGCTIEILEQKTKKVSKCKLLFPNGTACACLTKKHEFCVAKIMKCIENNEIFDTFVEQNKEFLSSQYEKRHRLDLCYIFFRCILLITYIFIILTCMLTNYFLILLAFFCLLVYNYYIYPRLSIEFTNRHLALIINNDK